MGTAWGMTPFCPQQPYNPPPIHKEAADAHPGADAQGESFLHSEECCSLTPKEVNEIILNSKRRRGVKWLLQGYKQADLGQLPECVITGKVERGRKGQREGKGRKRRGQGGKRRNGRRKDPREEKKSKKYFWWFKHSHSYMREEAFRDI